MTMPETQLPSLVDTYPAITMSPFDVLTSYADLEDHFWQSHALGIAFDKTYRSVDDKGELTSDHENNLRTFFHNVAAVGTMKYIHGIEMECFPEETRVHFFCSAIFGNEMRGNAQGCAFSASLMPQYMDDFLKKHPGLDKVRDARHIIRSFIQEIESICSSRDSL
jgi:hypothetical protein